MSRSTRKTQDGPADVADDQTKRPVVPLAHVNEEEHRRMLARRANAALSFDGSNAMTAPLLLRSYTVAGAPTASEWTGAVIYVSDETGGATIAFSDGTNWRRAQDRAVIA